MENDDEDLAIELDLNEEPLDTSLGLLLVEIDGYHARIEERIRQLEAVTARARHRLSLRLNSLATLNPIPIPTPTPTPDNETSPVNVEESGANLIARALESDSPEPKRTTEVGLYDCNICELMARDPVLTCCGHLFCWPCFCKLPCVSSNSTIRECPVCQGDVGEENVVPIYGNGGGESGGGKDGEESGFKIPARPRARRVESTRQWRVPRVFPRFVLDERYRQIRSRFRVMLQAESEAAGTSLAGRAAAAAAPGTTNVVLDDEMGVRSPRPSSGGLFSGIASSSSGFDSVERSGDNMESYDREQVMRAWTESLLADDRDTPVSNSGVGPSRTQGLDVAQEGLPLTMEENVAGIGRLETEAGVTTDDIVVTMTRRSSSSRRRASDDGGASPDSRRRRVRE